MRRYKFIVGLVVAAVWPLAARAQPSMPVIGYLSEGEAPSAANYRPLAAFRQGLRETGFVEGQNLRIEWRFAGGNSDRLRAYAAELARPPIVAIWASGNVAAQAAKAATTTIPVVFSLGDDPVAAGLVPSLSRPGGNLTGVTYVAGALPTKRLELLHELLPNVSTFGHLINPHNPSAERDATAVQVAASQIGVRIVLVKASTDSELDTAFAALSQSGAGALLINNDVFLFSRRERLVALTTRYAIPSINPNLTFAAEGGLLSYGTNVSESTRQVGIYVGRILKGAKPADLPVLQPTKFELVINLKTAKALGLTIPESFLLRADEVIE